MNKVIKLGMLFDGNSVPDFGSIEMSEYGDYVLLDTDVSKLNTVLTKTNCGDVFNVGSGAFAVVLDSPALWVYHSNTDTWYEVSAHE